MRLGHRVSVLLQHGGTDNKVRIGYLESRLAVSFDTTHP